ncbi:MAG: class II aldolase/adducin family protein [Myxococcota bacterium]|jgi:L-fuculose-phosphate aldolase|nr:class II aldolase/adducin family protein [Myxococcota bacterium]
MGRPDCARDDEDQLRQALVEAGRRVHAAGFVAAADGNLSVRLGEHLLLATPTGAAKGRLTPGELVKTDLQGQVLGPGRPSSELRLHLLLYQSRPDVRAAIHAHPPHAVALSLAGLGLAGCLLPETILSLGTVPTAPYATPTTEEVPASVQGLLQGCNALILARHGTLTFGEDLEQAFLRLEGLEHAARITCLARAMGPLEPLGHAQVARLEELGRRLGVPVAPGSCTACGTCASPLGEIGGSEEQRLVETIVRRVLARLPQSVGS